MVDYEATPRFWEGQGFSGNLLRKLSDDDGGGAAVGVGPRWGCVWVAWVGRLAGPTSVQIWWVWLPESAGLVGLASRKCRSGDLTALKLAISAHSTGQADTNSLDLRTRRGRPIRTRQIGALDGATRNSFVQIRASNRPNHPARNPYLHDRSAPGPLEFVICTRELGAERRAR